MVTPTEGYRPRHPVQDKPPAAKTKTSSTLREEIKNRELEQLYDDMINKATARINGDEELKKFLGDRSILDTPKVEDPVPGIKENV